MDVGLVIDASIWCMKDGTAHDILEMVHEDMYMRTCICGNKKRGTR